MGDNRERGARLAHETLAAQRDLAGAVGLSSLSGPAWARAIAETNRAGQVSVVGFDLVPATVALLKEGALHATVVQREQEVGYRCVQLLCQMVTSGVEAVLANQPDSRFVETGIDVVTLERTSWSISLADYLKRPRTFTADRATVRAVESYTNVIKLLLIGILPQADPDITRRQVARQSDSLIEQVIVAEETLIVDPGTDDAAGLAEARARTLVGVPLRVDSTAIGVLTLESSAANACAPEDVVLLERIANAVVVALENERLFRQAVERQREIEEAAQRQELLLQTVLDLASPVAAIAPGILVMPLIGVIDDQRAGRFIETLLHAISTREAEVVLVDISGVPFVDTYVANTIMQAAQAAQLLGAEVVLVGITPAVAQTLVHLGVNLSHITTQADLESGFEHALARKKGRIVYTT